jgi:hypothetical protein
LDSQYYFIKNSIDYLKYAIHSYHACIGAFNITDDWFKVNETGIIPCNKSSRFVGYHCSLICGYDEIGCYIQNCWGIKWAHYGFARLSWNQVISQFMYGSIIKVKNLIE